LPPNVGELTVSALLSAEEIICPVNMGDTNALRGLSRLTQTVHKLNQRGASVRFKALARLAAMTRRSAADSTARLLTRSLHASSCRLRGPSCAPRGVAQAVTRMCR